MVEVSILIAARNAADTIHATLRSVQRSRDVDWRCIVVDDHSTDCTAAMVRDLQAADSRISLLALPANRTGVVAARNFGLEQITSPLVAILDADDLMHRDRLRLQVEQLNAERLDIVGCHVRYFPRAQVGQGRLRYESWLNGMRSTSDLNEAAFVEMPLCHPSLLMRTSTMNQVGGYQDHPWPEDWDLYLRLHRANARIGVVPRVLHAWRLSHDSLSQSSSNYSLDAFTQCRAHHLAQSWNLNEYILWGYGSTGRALCRALSALHCRPKAIVELHPGRVGQTIQGAPVIAPTQLAGHLRQAREINPQFPPVLFSVAGKKARKQMTESAQKLGLKVNQDFIYCA